MTLARNLYTNPHIHFAVAQVVIAWEADQFKDICNKLRPILEAEFSSVTDRVTLAGQHQVNLEIGKLVTPEFRTEFAGLEAKLDDDGATVWIEQAGVIVRVPGNYKGRQELLAMAIKPVNMLYERWPELLAKRVSIVINSNINPAEVSDHPTFQIEDFIVPKFEFNNPDLNQYFSYRHEVWINLEGLLPDTLARVTIASASEGRNGIDLSIDVLEHSESPLSEVFIRLEKVKDIESHVFESTITDLTRKIYGICDN